MDRIDLLEPDNGAVTAGLQQHQLASDVTPAPDGGPADAGGGAAAWDHLQIVGVDRSVPRPVRFAWKRLPWNWRKLTYTLTISTSPALDVDACVLRGLGKPLVDVWHLFIGTPYCWKVTAQRGGQTVAESSVWRFVTNSLPPRWIRVPGITNVRDLGGWPLAGGRRIRQGLVYRGSELNGHLRISTRGRQVLEQELGIRTDLDLRAAVEGAEPALDPGQVRWIHAPISPYDCICDSAFADAYRRIFETLADPANYPLLFHCVGGADRAGTVAFLLNALLGKNREHLIHDYELTTLSVWGERSWTSEQFLSLIAALRPFAPDPDDLHTQVERYVLSLGVSPAAIAAIRRQLTTGCPITAIDSISSFRQNI